MDDVIFLLASERSGSNLTTRMFGAHRDICAPGPAHLFRILGGNLHRYPLTDRGQAEFLADLRALFAAKVSRWAIDGTDPDLGGIDTRSGTGAAILAVYRAEAIRTGKTGLFIKENQLYEVLDLVRALVRAPKFLYLYRDPRDMALSWQNARLARGGVMRAARIWADDQERFLSALETLNRHHLTATVSYEELITTPEESLRRVCTRLNLPYDPAMLSFHETVESRDNADASADWRNVGRPVLSGNAGKFRGALSAEQIAYVEMLCRTPMQRLGYKPETDPARPFGRFATRQLLERFLQVEEPWEKSAYADVPVEEKRQRQRWSDVRARIEARPIVDPVAG